MNKKISVNLAIAIAIIAMTVTFSVTMIVSMKIFDKTVSSVREKEITYNKIAEIDKVVRAGYYGDINDDTLRDMLSTGYMAGIGDRNAVYYTTRQYEELLNVQNGKIVGVGIDVIKDANGYARVIKVYTGSPAENVEIRKNSYITKIDGTDVKTLSLSQINSRLRGEQGTTVELSVLPLGNTVEQVLSIQRRQYDSPSVEYALPDGQTTGYIKINTFNNRTVLELDDAIRQMQERGLDAIVFDLRNNTGGDLRSAYKVIDMLCPAGKIVSEEHKDTSNMEVITSDINEVDLPMVVLVNQNTASGAELFAVAIREFGKGKIVGVKTAGKGTVQCEPVRLADSSAVSYTTGRLMTADGESFDGVGVLPDVDALLTPDEEANFYDLTVYSDSQIQKAFEVASTLITKITGQNGSLVTSGAQSAVQDTSLVPEDVQPDPQPDSQPQPDDTPADGGENGADATPPEGGDANAPDAGA